MRTVFAFLLFLLFLCLLGEVGAAWSAPVSLPITVTVSPPAPAAFTQPVSQAVSATVTLNGSQYQATGTLTGTLTFTPVAVNGNLPPGDPVLRPTIEQFLAGGRLVETARLGDELVLAGTGFGASGVLVIGNDIVPTLSWADGEIHALLDPLIVTAAPAGSFVTLRRGEDGERAWRDGPAIQALPSIVTGFELGRLHGDQVDEIIEAEAPDHHDAYPANKNRRERPRKKPPSQIPAAPVAATQVKPVAAEAAQKERQEGRRQAVALLHCQQPIRARKPSQIVRGAPALVGAQPR